MLKLNLIDFYSEHKTIDELNDTEEKTFRLDLLGEIIDKINEYNEHVFEYEFLQKRKKLFEKGISFSFIEKPAIIKTKWTNLFTKNISKETKKNIFFDDYRWHVFSYKVLNALEKDDARQAFNKCRKKEVYAFYQNKNEAFKINKASLLKSGDFDMDDDIYLFDPINKWTYVITHEKEQCGPYFYSLDI